jgi:hypothetical protein
MTGPGGIERRAPVTIKLLTRRQLWAVIFAAALVACVVGVVTTLVVQSQTNGELRTNSILGCDGSNLIRGDARLLTHRNVPTHPDNGNLTDWLLRVRDCSRTYDEGRVVIVSDDCEYRFLQELVTRHRVAIRSGCRFVPIG